MQHIVTSMLPPGVGGASAPTARMPAGIRIPAGHLHNQPQQPVSAAYLQMQQQVQKTQHQHIQQQSFHQSPHQHPLQQQHHQLQHQLSQRQHPQHPQHQQHQLQHHQAPHPQHHQHPQHQLTRPTTPLSHPHTPTPPAAPRVFSPSAFVPSLQNNQDNTDDHVSAFAKIIGVGVKYYMQTKEITLGSMTKRVKIVSSINRHRGRLSHQGKDVEVHLGDCDSITSLHFKIKYSNVSRRFSLTVYGKTGVLINGLAYQAGITEFIDTQDVIEIPCNFHAHRYHFLLPKDSPDKGRRTVAQEILHQQIMGTKPRDWAPSERDQFQRGFLTFGYHRPVEIKRCAGLTRRTISEVEQYSQQFVVQCLKFATGVDRKFLEKLTAVERLQESIKEVDPSLTTWSILEGSATSWARRIRNLHFLYEIFIRHRNKNVDILSGIPNSTINNEKPADWWSAEDDRCLLRGTYVHGYGNFIAIREDISLPFGATFKKKFQHQKQSPSSSSSGIRSRLSPHGPGGIGHINGLKKPEISTVTATLTSPPTSSAGGVLIHPLIKKPKLNGLSSLTSDSDTESDGPDLLERQTPVMQNGVNQVTVRNGVNLIQSPVMLASNSRGMITHQKTPALTTANGLPWPPTDVLLARLMRILDAGCKVLSVASLTQLRRSAKRRTTSPSYRNGFDLQSSPPPSRVVSQRTTRSSTPNSAPVSVPQSSPLSSPSLSASPSSVSSSSARPLLKPTVGDSTLWNKKAKADFMRVLMTYGVATPPDWEFIRQKSGLHSMSDETLSSYYQALMQQCHQLMEGDATSADATATHSGKQTGSNAYSIFCKEHRQRFKEQYPALNFGEINGKLGQMWRSLPQEEKKPYEDRAKAHRQKYRQHMESVTGLVNNEMTLASARKLKLRLDLMSSLRKSVIHHEDAIHRFAPPADYMPGWWKTGDHDIIFLKGVLKHGIGQWDLIFDDVTLPWPWNIPSYSGNVVEDFPRPQPQSCTKRLKRCVAHVLRNLKKTGTKRRIHMPMQYR